MNTTVSFNTHQTALGIVPQFCLNAQATGNDCEVCRTEGLEVGFAVGFFHQVIARIMGNIAEISTRQKVMT